MPIHIHNVRMPALSSMLSVHALILLIFAFIAVIPMHAFEYTFINATGRFDIPGCVLGLIDRPGYVLEIFDPAGNSLCKLAKVMRAQLPNLPSYRIVAYKRGRIVGECNYVPELYNPLYAPEKTVIAVNFGMYIDRGFIIKQYTELEAFELFIDRDDIEDDPDLRKD